MFGVIKRELRRRSAIEAVIGHMKTDGHLGRCYLKGRAGDAANAVLTAVGHNLRLVLAWLRILLRLLSIALARLFTIPHGAQFVFLTVNYTSPNSATTTASHLPLSAQVGKF